MLYYFRYSLKEIKFFGTKFFLTKISFLFQRGLIFEVLQYIKSLNVDRIQPAVTPGFVPGCDSELMFDLGALAETYNCFIQTHASECKEEVNEVKKLHPEHPNEASVLETHRLLVPNSILAHCVHINEDERKLILKNQAGIAHCPLSNYCFSFE